MRVYIQGQNLFTITNYTGLDPAITQAGVGGGSDTSFGIDYGNYPMSRTFLLGLSATF
jgi:hypothetical protein